MIRLALFQPDIPQNTGTILRLCACLGVEAHIVEPAGFPVTDRAFRRAGMDYLDQVRIVRHASFAAFRDACAVAGWRLVAVETGPHPPLADFSFARHDILMLGRESAGTPAGVLAACDAAVAIPMVAGVRSLNVAMAAALSVGEALRQTGGFPKTTADYGILRDTQR
jgi:tRNA (cytidine/uridine-2'-O-)-methyltransferase